MHGESIVNSMKRYAIVYTASGYVGMGVSETKSFIHWLKTSSEKQAKKTAKGWLKKKKKSQDIHFHLESAKLVFLTRKDILKLA